MSKTFDSFEAFYPYYLEEHSDRTNRRLHFIGSTAGLVLFVLGIASGDLATFGAFLLAALVTGYGMAWIGHFFFEHNRPATFQYPWMSYKGDWKMWWQMLTGKIAF